MLRSQSNNESSCFLSNNACLLYSHIDVHLRACRLTRRCKLTNLNQMFIPLKNSSSKERETNLKVSQVKNKRYIMYEQVSSETHLKVMYPIKKSNDKFQIQCSPRPNFPYHYTGEPFIPLKLEFNKIHLLLIFTFYALKTIYKECFLSYYFL